MKVVGVAVARTGADLNEPIPLTVTNDLSSFGFFQRQVRSPYSSSLCTTNTHPTCECTAMHTCWCARAASVNQTAFSDTFAQLVDSASYQTFNHVLFQIALPFSPRFVWQTITIFVC